MERSDRPFRSEGGEAKRTRQGRGKDGVASEQNVLRTFRLQSDDHATEVQGELIAATRARASTSVRTHLLLHRIPLLRHRRELRFHLGKFALEI